MINFHGTFLFCVSCASIFTFCFSLRFVSCRWPLSFSYGSFCPSLASHFSSTHLIFVCCIEYKNYWNRFSARCVDFLSLRKPCRIRREKVYETCSWLIYCCKQMNHEFTNQVLAPSKVFTSDVGISSAHVLVPTANALRLWCVFVVWMRSLSLWCFAYTFYKYVFDLPCDFCEIQRFHHVVSFQWANTPVCVRKGKPFKLRRAYARTAVQMHNLYSHIPDALNGDLIQWYVRAGRKQPHSSINHCFWAEHIFSLGVSGTHLPPPSSRLRIVLISFIDFDFIHKLAANERLFAQTNQKSYSVFGKRYFHVASRCTKPPKRIRYLDIDLQSTNTTSKF